MAEKYEERAQKLVFNQNFRRGERIKQYKNLIRMISAHTFKNKELINADGNLFLTVDSLITINNYITGSRNIQLRQVNVRPAFYFNSIWILPELNQNYTNLLISLTRET